MPSIVSLACMCACYPIGLQGLVYKSDNWRATKEAVQLGPHRFYAMETSYLWEHISLPHLAHYNKLAEECNEIRISKPGLKVKDILRQMPGLDEAPGECRQPHVPHAPHWYGCIERDGPPAWHRACDMPATATCHDDMCAWCTVLSHR